MPDARLAFAWFPAGEFEAALDRWPDLLDEPIADHGDYCRFIERQLRSYAGAHIGVAPISVDDLVQWSSEQGLDAGSPEARAEFAADRAIRGDLVAWPPGRNDACWCGSGQKYKWCCGREPD